MDSLPEDRFFGCFKMRAQDQSMTETGDLESRLGIQVKIIILGSIISSYSQLSLLSAIISAILKN
jgi:hypothetical protein